MKKCTPKTQTLNQSDFKKTEGLIIIKYQFNILSI